MAIRREYGEGPGEYDARVRSESGLNTRCIVPDTRPQQGDRPGESGATRHYYQQRCQCAACRAKRE